MYHPWRRLRGIDDWLLEWDQLPEGISGEINWPTHTITIDPRLSQAQRRCTLAHELVHIHHHHTSHQPAAVERQVRAETARWLIPDLHQLRDALLMPDPAADLWVTPAVLRDRLDHLTDAERQAIEAALTI